MAGHGPRPLDADGAVAVLRERLPAFGAAIDEHLADNGGQLLLHLVMGISRATPSATSSEIRPPSGPSGWRSLDRRAG